MSLNRGASWHDPNQADRAIASGQLPADTLNLELTVRQPSAKHLLVELANRGLRDLGDERPVLRDLPAGHPGSEEVRELLRLSRGPRPQHHAGQRPFAPARVRHPDDRSFLDSRVSHELILQLHRGDPLAARLNNVLDAVSDNKEPALVDNPDVASAQPPIAELLWCGIVVIRPRDPRPAHLDLALADTVPRQLNPVPPDHPHLHAPHNPPRAHAPVQILRGSL